MSVYPSFFTHRQYLFLHTFSREIDYRELVCFRDAKELLDWFKNEYWSHMKLRPYKTAPCNDQKDGMAYSVNRNLSSDPDANLPLLTVESLKEGVSFKTDEPHYGSPTNYIHWCLTPETLVRELVRIGLDEAELKQSFQAVKSDAEVEHLLYRIAEHIAYPDPADDM